MTLDYSDWKWPFGKYKGKLIAEIPDTYLERQIYGGKMNSIETRKLIRLLEFIVQEIDENAQDSLSDIVNEGLDRFKLMPNRMNSELRFF